MYTYTHTRMHAAHKHTYHMRSSMSIDAGITLQTSTHVALKYKFYQNRLYLSTPFIFS